MLRLIYIYSLQSTEKLELSHVRIMHELKRVDCINSYLQGQELTFTIGP